MERRTVEMMREQAVRINKHLEPADQIIIAGRNNYWAIDSTSDGEVLDAGLSPKEVEIFLRGFRGGLKRNVIKG